MRALLIITGFLAVIFAAFVDLADLGVIPLWVYGAAHLAILAGLFKRQELLSLRSPKRLVFVVPIHFFTIPVACLAMSSLGHDLHKLRPGMTVEEVRQKLACYKEGTGLKDPWRGREFSVADALVFRHPDASEGDLTWGVVYFKDGRVTPLPTQPGCAPAGWPPGEGPRSPRR
jgi:hypothetical protein